MDLREPLSHRSPAVAVVVACVTFAALIAAPLPTPVAAAEIHRCPQPDGTMRFQDRPCAATQTAAPPSSSPAQTAPAATSSQARTSAPATPEPPTRTTPSIGAPSLLAPTPPTALPTTRAEYLALNEARCAAGDRRACVAAECERSGSLGSADCQAALGHHSGEGWRVRPVDDVLEPGRSADRHRLTCTRAPRATQVLIARDDSTAAAPDATVLSRANLAAFAREFCAERAAASPN